jgi:hypothetical protein
MFAESNSQARVDAPSRSSARRFLGLLVCALGVGLPGSILAFERTEERAACADVEPLRKPLFGDLHVHTRYSFDSYISSQRNDPWDAYRYAKGEPITLPNPNAEQVLIAQIQRPLDFTAITDHAEFLGEVNACTDGEWSLARLTPLCLMTNSSIFIAQLLAANSWVTLGVSDDSAQKERSFLCDLWGVDCTARLGVFWDNIQRAAEDHYDRSAACSFTTFVAYEYTDAPNFSNLHRNVIFRNERVTALPISTYETGTQNVPELWRRLDSVCIAGAVGCDVLAIPHNPNLSAGLMFPDPQSVEEARLRSFFEPVVELTQHKASSECRYDRLAGRGVDTRDEFCTFEQNKTDNLSSLGVVGGEMRSEKGAPVSIDDFGRRNMVRNVLKDGLALEATGGINPFKLGFIGSTDTHSATPGGAEEDSYVGHLGRRDSGYRNVQDHFEDNPGGHAVVWAEENSRDSIFEAMRRKETYATSGTRPIVRFFAGYELESALCGDPDWVANAYAQGVPMGGDLARGPADAKPRFLVSALKDVGSPGHPGVDLQRIQIIKGWVDAAGQTHERVVDVAGPADVDAGVNPDTCAPTGTGAQSLCAVWEDAEFDPAVRAFYYARVLENPSCRWSTLQCQAAGVNPFSDTCEADAQAAPEDAYARCCLDPASEPFYSPTIQERAWTSPIWYIGAQGQLAGSAQ